MSARCLYPSALATALGIVLASAQLPAAENLRYPDHVRTQAQQEAWRIGWPRWRGPQSNCSGIDAGYRLVEDMSQARQVWQSEERIPPLEHHNVLRSGYASPIVAAGLVYLFYTWPTGLGTDMAQISKEDVNALKTGGSGRNQSDQPGDDVILCLDALSGKTIWKQVYEGKGLTLLGSGKGGGHYTMTVADGRAFAIGSTGRLYCHDAATGKEHWVIDTGHKTPINGNLVASGNLVAMDLDGRVHAFSVADGKKIWTAEQSYSKGTRGSSQLLLWERDGAQPYLIHEGGPACIDPRTGKELWRVERKHDKCNTIAVHGDWLIVNGSSGLDDVGNAYQKEGLDVSQISDRYFGATCYRISEKGATLAWQLPPKYAMRGYCTPAIYDGHVYILSHYPWGRGKRVDGEGPQFFLAVELETGSIAKVWNHDDLGCTYQPFAAEKTWFYRGEFKHIDGAASQPLPRGSVEPGGAEKRSNDAHSERDASPAYVCGLIYVRNATGIACWDLRAR